MPKTYFADSFGVSSNNVATAEDIFALAQYLYRYRPDILTLTRNSSSTMATTTDHGSHIITSTHPFVNDSRFIGGKTGRTPAAGETMLTILRINERPIAFIVLGSGIGNRASDTRSLINKTYDLF
jgi:D-alanyl-D-alanine carboxypeptidase